MGEDKSTAFTFKGVTALSNTLADRVSALAYSGVSVEDVLTKVVHFDSLSASFLDVVSRKTPALLRSVYKFKFDGEGESPLPPFYWGADALFSRGVQIEIFGLNFRARRLANRAAEVDIYTSETLGDPNRASVREAVVLHLLYANSAILSNDDSESKRQWGKQYESVTLT